MKKIFAIFISMFFIIMMAACETEVTSLEVVNNNTKSLIEDFSLEDLTLKVFREDGSIEEIDVSESMISSNNIEKLTTAGQHEITVTYEGVSTDFSVVLFDSPLMIDLFNVYEKGISEGAINDLTYEEWIDSIKGEDGIGIESVNINDDGEFVVVLSNDEEINLGVIKGEDASNILLQTVDNIIQWKYEHESTWTDLIEVADGKDVQLQVNNGYIQWSYMDEGNWRNLLDLEDITGEDADQVLFRTANGYIQWKHESSSLWTNLVELSTLVIDKGEPGDDGREIELQVANNYIQWRYMGSNWRNLVSLDSLIGEPGREGEQGEQGDPGESVEMRVSGNYIQWKLESDRSWNDLVDLDSLVGDQGEQGESGQSPMFQVSNGYIQWKLENDTSWSNLIEISTLVIDKGDPGTDGREVSLQVTGGYIQWQYIGDEGWYNLIDLATLTGADGQDGTDGREVQFQVAGGYIQWQYSGDVTWTNLIDLATLTGQDGIDGQDGTDGREVLFQVAGGYIQWQYSGDVTWTNLIDLATLTGQDGIDGQDGTDGREVQFQVAGGYIQWQYSGDVTWTNLIDLATLTGQDGIDGQDGTDGREVLFQVAGGYIQWQYSGEETWMNLIDLATLTGKDGVGIVSTEINEFGEMIITYSDGTESNIGEIIVYYTIQFKDFNGYVIDTQLLKYGESIQHPTPPTIEGYNFIDWNQEITQVTENATIQALYEIQTFNVTFLDNNGEIIEIQEVNYGESADNVVTPLIDGYTFITWSSDFNNVKQNITLTPEYALNSYIVNFVDPNGNLLSKQEVSHGFSAIEPRIVLPDGYKDYSWSQSFVSIEEDCTIEATYIAEIFSIDFVSQYGDSYTEDYEFNQELTLPTQSDIGYSFGGWFTDAEFTNSAPLNMPASNITLYAKWSPRIFAVDFVTNGGTPIDTLFIEYGGNMNGLPQSTMEGMNFLGWYLDPELTETVPTFMPAKDLVLYASFEVDIVYPTGVYNYKYASPELRNTFFAAAEKYLLDKVNAGIPLFAYSTFKMYSSRVQLPVDSFIPEIGYGSKFGTMSADDSTIIMDDGLYGNVGEYTYRGAVGSNPETFNQWLYEGSVTSDLMEYFIDAPYVFVFNDDKTGYAVEPSMASDVPQPVDETVLETGITVSKTWQMPIREDLMFTLLDGTADELGVDTSGWDMTIDAHDFIDTYKLALEQKWSRAIAGGGDFLYGTQAIVNAQEFVDGEATWEEVGLRVVDDYTIEFEFINDMSEWTVMYWLTSLFMAPINLDMYNALTDVDVNGVHSTTYGIDNYSIAYTGPYQVDFYEPDSIILMSKNPNFHTPELYFYTHRTFKVILESDIIFQEFNTGKLDDALVPTESYDLFKDHPNIKRFSGATAYRLNINMLGTIEAQRQEFSDSDYVPEPILANEDFRRAMYFGVDRETLAFEVMKRAEPMPYLFSSAYVVDPASGIPFRDTLESAIVDENRSIDSFGYNPDLAKAYFDQAIADLVADGTYSAGDEIVLDMVIQAGSTSQALMSEFLITEWEGLFYNNEYDITVSWTITPAAFPNNYFDYIIPGNFDTGIGGISGSTLDAASFLNAFDSMNSSGFTLNFGKDTTVAEIEVVYVSPETGKTVREIWSFDAIYSVLMGETDVINGEKYTKPTVSTYATSPTTAQITIKNFDKQYYEDFTYTLEYYDPIMGYVPVLNQTRVPVFSSTFPIDNLNPEFDFNGSQGDYRVIIEYDFINHVGDATLQTITSSWLQPEIIKGFNYNSHLDTSLSMTLQIDERDYERSVVNIEVYDQTKTNIISSANVDFSNQENIIVNGLEELTTYYLLFTFNDGHKDYIEVTTLESPDPISVNDLLNSTVGEEYYVEGVVSALNLTYGFFIQDADGTAIYIDEMFAGVEVGDHVVLRGNLGLWDSYGNYQFKLEAASLVKDNNGGNNVLIITDQTATEIVDAFQVDYSPSSKIYTADLTFSHIDTYGYAFFDVGTAGDMQITFKYVDYAPDLETAEEGLVLENVTFVVYDVNFDNLRVIPAENINIGQISFDSNGGSYVEDIVGVVGEPIQILQQPTKEGHTFAGWYIDESLTTPISFDTMQSGETILYAKWEINSYTINFEPNEGTTPSAIILEFNESIPNLNESSRSGYDFREWYEDETLLIPFNYTTMPARDVILYAGWDIQTNYIVYYLYEGTNGNNPLTYTVETETITLDSPEKEGYIFAGWYDNSNYTGEPIFEIPSGTTGTIRLYAKWIENYTIYSDYEFDLKPDNTYKITRYVGSSDIVVIPDTYNGISITEIGPQAFEGARFTDLYIPNNIISIGSNAFSNPTGVDVKIYTEFLTKPSGWDVNWNPNFIKVYWNVIPDFNSDYIMALNEENTYEIVKYIGSSSIVNIPEMYNNIEVTSIGASAFYRSNIIKLTISKNINDIYINPFMSNYSMIEIIVDEQNIHFLSEEGVLFNADKTTLIHYPAAKEDEIYTIPSTVEVLLQSSFNGAFNLNQVIIPEGVTTIGASVFDNMNIQSITLPSTVHTINWGGGLKNSNIKNIYVAENSPYFQSVDGVLYSADGIKLVVYPGGKTDTIYNVPLGTQIIGYSSISNDYLEELILPDTLTTIENNAIQYLTNVSSIIIPISVEVIEHNAFGFGMNCMIYVEAPYKPLGWSDMWAQDNIVIVWGYDGT